MSRNTILVSMLAILALTSLACGVPVTVTIGQPTRRRVPATSADADS